MYENVHPNLTLVLLFISTEVECGKGLLDTGTAQQGFEWRGGAKEECVDDFFLEGGGMLGNFYLISL